MAEIWNLSALCRCCHKDGQFTDLRTLLQDSDTRNYATLLQETFNISMDMPLLGASYAICDTCIAELIRAHGFKVQVAECEQKFHEYCQNELATQCDLKEEVESLHEDESDDNDNGDFDDLEMGEQADEQFDAEFEDVKHDNNMTMDCVICNSPLSDKEETVLVKKKGLDTLYSVFRSVEEMCLHSTCRKKYTKGNLTGVYKPLEFKTQTENTLDPNSSNWSHFPFQKKCFICAQELVAETENKKPIERRRLIHQVINEKTKGTIVQALRDNQQSNINQVILERIEHVNLVRAQARYHRDCYLRVIIPKKNLKRGRPEDSDVTSAMEIIYEFIEKNHDIIFSIQELKSLLTNSYTPDDRTIIKKLCNKFKERMLVKKIPGKSPLVKFKVSDDNDNGEFDDSKTEEQAYESDDQNEAELEDENPDLADYQKDGDEHLKILNVKTIKEKPTRPRGRPKKNRGKPKINITEPRIISIQSLYQDVQKYVKDEGDKRTCTLCNYTYQKHVVNVYEKHLQEEHSINIEYKCDDCGKICHNYTLLLMHNYKHAKHKNPEKRTNVTELPTSLGVVKKEDSVADYHSDKSEPQLFEDELPIKKRRIIIHKEWNLCNTFSNMNQAEDFVNAENTWGRRCTRMTEDGQKRFYRCNKVRKNGPQCAAELYLLLVSDNDDVLLYRKAADHNHQDIGVRDHYGIRERTKTEINKLFDLHLKPKSILAALKKMDGIKLPSMQQLNNYLCSIRRTSNTIGYPSIQLGELQKWIYDRDNIPEDENQTFVLKHQIIASDHPTFRFSLTTKKLLRIARSIEVVHADATHKLIWQGFPVTIVGATNKNRKFYPLCLAVSTNEEQEDFEVIFRGLKEKIKLLFDEDFQPKVLVCDAAEAIKNAFLSVFDCTLAVRMCWAHARKNMQRKLEQTIAKTETKSILEDIDALHKAPSVEVFDTASRAFIEKYAALHLFIDYFRQEWIVKNRNWFLGAAPLSPATNDALESFYKCIKDNNTVRERYPLSSFLIVASEMVTKWSNQISEEPSPETNIELKEWAEGYHWAKRNFQIQGLSSDPSCTAYLVPSGYTSNDTTNDESWRTFDEYKQRFFALCEIKLSKTDWKESTCTCPQFFKKYICKHIIGLAFRLKLVTVPLEAKIIPIGKKRKRSTGRPPKYKPALIVK